MAKDGFQYFHRPEKEKKTAVALEYEPTDQAPKIIASGQGYVAVTDPITTTPRRVPPNTAPIFFPIDQVAKPLFLRRPLRLTFFPVFLAILHILSAFILN